MKIIPTEKWPIKMWLDEIEDGALEQAKNLARLPFLHQWVAIMPDAHQGFGMPIGGVIACKGHVIPNAVGVDIGCGMCAVRTTLKTVSPNKLQNILNHLKSVIPTGFSHHKRKQDSKLMPKMVSFKDYVVVSRLFEEARDQLGTLGGGNHFIEFQKGSDGYIWIMVHSGSRNFGKQVADYYNKLAIRLNCPPEVPKAWQLAHLPLDAKEGQSYMKEMQYCVDFAFANRKLMMERIKEVFSTFCPCSFGEMINIAHNYAALETHYGQKVVVHRKGATQAFKGTIGIIPGSMGTPSYIVEGLGNEESFKSCSHGAGRKMGRKQAIRTLKLSEEQKKMKQILGKPTSQRELEEAPGAYKDIEQVMNHQTDLVHIKVRLEPLAVIKG